MVQELKEKDLEADPFHQFGGWFQAAFDADLRQPNAMSLATVDPQGQPSSRMVLLKYWDENGFVFFTNYGSRKAFDLTANPHAALLFYWERLDRQVRIEGFAEKTTAAQSLNYFATRPRGSQLGAWCSAQSQTISSRAILESKLLEISRKFKNREVPLPTFWGGFCVVPSRFEFWQQGEDRLHDRFVYSRGADGAWAICRLAP